MERTGCIIFKCSDEHFYDFDEGDANCLKLILRIACEVKGMIKSGCTRFICALRFAPELYFAEAVLDFKRALPDAGIKLIILLSPPEANLSSASYLSRYEAVLAQAEHVSIGDCLSAAAYDKIVCKYMKKHAKYILTLLSASQPDQNLANENEVTIYLHEYCPKRKPTLSIIWGGGGRRSL